MSYTTIRTKKKERGAEGGGEKVENDSSSRRRRRSLSTSSSKKKKKQMVINDIQDSAPQPLQAIKLLATLRAGKCTPEDAKAKFAEWLSGDASSDLTTRALAAALALADGDFVSALRACHGGAGRPSAELRALSVQALLAADRPELAEAAAADLASSDDDGALSSLAAAWVGLALGGRRAEEAREIYAELADRFGASPRLSAGAAAAALRCRDWEAAERSALDAFAKDVKSGDALCCAAAAAAHLGKHAASGRHRGQLLSTAPGHPMAVAAAAMEEAFDRAASAFT
jgi:coatomer protein complex subunit epsilon